MAGWIRPATKKAGKLLKRIAPLIVNIAVQQIIIRTIYNHSHTRR
jgi:hypothetical protein